MLLVFLMALAFAGFSLYVGSAAHFIMDLLHLEETDFGWMFIPLVGGLITGSALAARLAARLTRRRFVVLAYWITGLGVALNLGYNLWAGPAISVPWAVLPLFAYSFGLSFLTPSVTMAAMDYFPRNQGMAASMQSFVQMSVFATVAGFVVPLLFGSGLRLAIGMASVWGASLLLLWTFMTLQAAQRRQDGQG